MFDTLTNVLLVVIGFGFVIFIHELGHYLFARRNGVFVEKFAIGFDFWGLKLASWKRGGTEYVVGVFPLGGYVRMLGQNDNPGADAGPDRPDSFQRKTVRQRLEIISAGVLFNFLSAFAFCWFALVVGVHRTPPVVAQVQHSALEAGLRPGDEVVAVSGRPVESWDEIFGTWASLPPGSTARIEVKRGGGSTVIEVPVVRREDEPLNIPRFGRPLEAVVSSVSADSPAEAAGLRDGDRVLAVDGVVVPDWATFTDLVRRNPERTVPVEVERTVDGVAERLTLQLTPSSKASDLLPARDLGFQPEHPPILRIVEGPAAEVGLLPGDLIRAIDDKPVSSWYALWREGTWLTPGTSSVDLLVERDGATRVLSIPVGPWRDWSTTGHGLPALGIAGEPLERVVVGAVVQGSAAEAAGLKPGDIVTAVEVDVSPPERGGLPGIIDAVTGRAGAPHVPHRVDRPNWTTISVLSSLGLTDRMALSVDRAGESLSLELRTKPATDLPEVGFAGVAPTAKEVLHRLGPVEAIAPALRAPFRLVEDTLAGLRSFLRGIVSVKLMSGPLGILGVTYGYAEKSVGDLLQFLAMLSVNLAVMNFLPIPVTDGGHAVFLAYEKLRGRRMPEEVEARFQWAGLLFLLSIFVLATVNDVGRLLGF